MTEEETDKERAMRGKKALVPERIREIKGSFAFIEHRFLWHGFMEQLGHREMVLYMFLVLVSNRLGLSWYSLGQICYRLRLSAEEYHQALQSLIEKDLIVYDGALFQVLSLPEPQRDSPPCAPPSQVIEEAELCEATDIAQLVDRVFHRKSRP
jgi:hypothetical protein